MKKATPIIKFQGHEFLLINSDGNHCEGAIATKEQYDNFEESYVHLYSNGVIKRHFSQIGTLDDIEFWRPLTVKEWYGERLDL